MRLASLLCFERPGGRPSPAAVLGLCLVAGLYPPTAAADWTPATRVTHDPWLSSTSASHQAAVAVGAGGSLHAVWLDDRDHLGGSFEVYHCERSANGVWGAEWRLTFEVFDGIDPETGDPIVVAEDKEAPGVVADSQGNLWLSYANLTTQTPSLLRYDAQTAAWNLMPLALGPGGVSDLSPLLAVDGQDGVHAVWKGLEGGGEQIFYRRHEVPGGWGSVEQLTTAASSKATPALAMDAAGAVHVVWADDRDSPGHWELYTKQRPAAGAWSADERLTFQPGSDARGPSLLADPGGNLHLAWEDDRQGNFEIYYRRREAASSQWQTEERLTDEPAPSHSPHLAIDPSNQVHLVWQDGRYLGGWSWQGFSLYYRKKSVLWSEETRLAARGTRGSLAADAASHLHVLFTAELPAVGNPEIYHLEFDPALVTPPEPKEIVLLLDVSGSMGGREDGTPAPVFTESRLYKAGQALSSFLDRLSLRNPTDVALGLATFPSQAAPCPSAGFVTPGPTPLAPLTDATRLEIIQNTIPGLSASGGTPMATGLAVADAAFSAGNLARMTLLVSDGAHNCPHGFPPGLLAGLAAPVYTVGIGSAGEVDLPRLNDIANQTGGEFRDATTSTPLDMLGWLKTLLQVTLGLQAESDPRGVLRPGERATHEAYLTDRDSQLVFGLSWSTPRERSVGFALRTPEGKLISQQNASALTGVRHISRPTYQLYFLGEDFLSRIRRAGTWKIELSAEEARRRRPEPYAYDVTTVSDLRLLVELDRTSYSAGDPMALQAAVFEGSRRLRAEIAVEVQAPGEGLGNWLVSQPTPAVPPTPAPPARVADAAAGALLKAQLVRAASGATFAVRPQTRDQRLHDDGSGGDLEAGDRLYGLLFEDTRVPGTYTFRVRAAGRTSSGQRYRRELYVQRHLGVRPDPQESPLVLIPVPGAPRGFADFELTLTPRDALGNSLGPGFADRVRFTLAGGDRQDPVQDRLDGSYSQRVRLPQALVPQQKGGRVIAEVAGTRISRPWRSTVRREPEP